MRESVSSGTRITLSLLPDWPINVNAADAAGNVELILPSEDLNAFNRPINVYAVYYPGVPPANLTGDMALQNPHVSAPVPAYRSGQNAVVDMIVPGPLPTGPVTVLAVGEYTN